MEELFEGQILDGEIARVVAEAVFVDVGAGPDGFIPRREVDQLNQAQQQKIREGESIRVSVVNIPATGGNPLLTIAPGGDIAAAGDLPELPGDLWQRVEKMYNVGDVLEGIVRTIKRYGAFVELPVGVDGLVHVSEMQDGYTSSPYDVVSPGKQVKVRIIELDVDRERIGLSMKEVEQP